MDGAKKSGWQPQARLCAQVGEDGLAHAAAELVERLVAAQEPLDAEAVYEGADDGGRLGGDEVAAEDARGDPARDDLALQLGAAFVEAARALADGGAAQASAHEVEEDAVEVAMLAGADGEGIEIGVELGQRSGVGGLAHGALGAGADDLVGALHDGGEELFLVVEVVEHE